VCVHDEYGQLEAVRGLTAEQNLRYLSVAVKQFQKVE